MPCPCWLTVPPPGMVVVEWAQCSSTAALHWPREASGMEPRSGFPSGEPSTRPAISQLIGTCSQTLLSSGGALDVCSVTTATVARSPRGRMNLRMEAGSGSQHCLQASGAHGGVGGGQRRGAMPSGGRWLARTSPTQEKWRIDKTQLTFTQCPYERCAYELWLWTVAIR